MVLCGCGGCAVHMKLSAFYAGVGAGRFVQVMWHGWVTPPFLRTFHALGSLNQIVIKRTHLAPMALVFVVHFDLTRSSGGIND